MCTSSLLKNSECCPLALTLIDLAVVARCNVERCRHRRGRGPRCTLQRDRNRRRNSRSLWMFRTWPFSILARKFFDSIHLAIGSRSRINDSVLRHDQGLDLQFLRLEDRRDFAVGRDAINPRRGAGSREDISRRIGCDRPDVGRGRSREHLNAGASSSPPALRKATPCAVPLINSSNFDCSQVRVPSARANGESARMESVRAAEKASVLQAKVIPRCWMSRL